MRLLSLHVNYVAKLVSLNLFLCGKVRSVEEQTHEDTTECTGDWNSHDPGQNEETNSLPVYSLEGTIAETNTDGCSSDAHGCRNWERVLGEEEDGDGGTHLHRATSGWRVICDLVTHDLHDVVTIGDETERNGGRENSELPDWDRLLGGSCVTSLPCRVDDGPWTDRVTDIIGTVSE